MIFTPRGITASPPHAGTGVVHHHVDADAAMVMGGTIGSGIAKKCRVEVLLLLLLLPPPHDDDDDDDDAAAKDRM